MSRFTGRRWGIRWPALVAVAVLGASFLLAPVQAHITTNNPGHNWNSHYRALAAQLFFTKKQTNDRFAHQVHTHEGLISELDQLGGLSCDWGGEPGEVGLSFDGGGVAQLTCIPDGGVAPLVCVGGTTACGSQCVDTTSDRSNCGACGNACAAGHICSEGTCQLSCQAGLTQCSGVCRDLSTDRLNCGSCGHICASGQMCSAGVCVSA